MSLMLSASTCWQGFSPPKELKRKSSAASHSSFLRSVLLSIVFVLPLHDSTVADPKGINLSAYNKSRACDSGLHFSELIVADTSEYSKFTL